MLHGLPLGPSAWRPWLLTMGGCAITLAVVGRLAHGQEKVIEICRPEQRHLQVRDPLALPSAPLPRIATPATVTAPAWEDSVQSLTLDDALRLTLANSKVIRVLAGTTAVASGATIYDPAITNTTIDQAQGRFDPNVELRNTFSRQSVPLPALDPRDPRRALFAGLPTEGYDMNLGVSKVNSLGGTARLGVDVNPTHTQGENLPLNPQTRSAVELSYTQPLLQGAGARANLAPIVIARLNTERSFFQFKDSVDQSVRSVIQSYWSLVFARTDVWARRQQVDQNAEALRRAEARLQAGLADVAEVSQARSALANFKANLIASESNLLNQEEALANIMGLPPTGHLLPVTPPTAARLVVHWDELVRLAEVNRPDLIELKLVLEADRQMIYQARNQARPKLDAVVLYRWNGLEGQVPNRSEIETFGGRYTEWSMGLNFSVPIGLRATRAALRQQELILLRDQANLDQGVHSATHLLALRVRNLAQYYDQYQAYREARMAAHIDLDRQLEYYRRGRTILLNVLQAISTWGNSVSAESQALTQYNTELANLELETGTILASHGIQFYEERFCSVGPLGELGRQKPYPKSLPPGPNQDRYPHGTTPAENFFDLEDPLKLKPEDEGKGPGK